MPEQVPLSDERQPWLRGALPSLDAARNILRARLSSPDTGYWTVEQFEEVVRREAFEAGRDQVMAAIERYVLAIRTKSRAKMGTPEVMAAALLEEAEAFSALCDIADRNGRIEDVRAVVAAPVEDAK